MARVGIPVGLVLLPLARRAFDRTLGRRAAGAGLLAAFVGYVALAAWVPAFDDEIYYWCWAQHLQASYFDHPPMTALMVRAGVELFGNHSVLAIRLPACAAFTVILAVLGYVTRPRRFLFWAAATPAFTFGAVLLTPDTPLMLFWALYLGWLVAVHSRLAPEPGDVPRPLPGWAWAVGGLVLGCAGLGKYTAILLVPSGFATFLIAPNLPWRKWLPGYAAHGVLAALVASPVLYFNWMHDFAPMKFQWQHANQAGRSGLVTLGEFVGVQFALIGVLPFTVLPWAWGNWRRLAADPRLRVGFALYAVPLTFFLWKAVRGPLEGNWALACYLGFWPVAAVRCQEWATTPARVWWVRAGFLSSAGAVVVAAVHLIVPIPLVSANADRVSRQPVRLAIAEEAASVARRFPGLPVYCPTYQLTALLRFHGADARHIDGATRPSNFTLRPEHVTDSPDCLVMNEGPIPPDLAPGYGWPELVATFPFTVRGETTGYFQLYRYTRGGDGCESAAAGP